MKCSYFHDLLYLPPAACPLSLAGQVLNPPFQASLLVRGPQTLKCKNHHSDIFRPLQPPFSWRRPNPNKPHPRPFDSDGRSHGYTGLRRTARTRLATRRGAEVSGWTSGRQGGNKLLRDFGSTPSSVKNTCRWRWSRSVEQQGRCGQGRCGRSTPPVGGAGAVWTSVGLHERTRLTGEASKPMV